MLKWDNGNVLWGIGCLIIWDYFNYSSHFVCSLKHFCQFPENCWENHSNVQGKPNLLA